MSTRELHPYWNSTEYLMRVEHTAKLIRLLKLYPPQADDFKLLEHKERDPDFSVAFLAPEDDFQSTSPYQFEVMVANERVVVEVRYGWISQEAMAVIELGVLPAIEWQLKSGRYEPDEEQALLELREQRINEVKEFLVDRVQELGIN